MLYKPIDSSRSQRQYSNAAQIIKAPSDYVTSLPSKGMRNAAIDALNVWYEVPSGTTKHISAILHGLHTSSLMLDDIEDGSPLRRGYPATHCVFGTAQTINSANFQFIETLDIVRQELGLECLGIYAEELRLLHIGQSQDLHWTAQVKCPSVAEYVKMIDYSGSKYTLLSELKCRLTQVQKPAGSSECCPGC